MAKKTSKTYYTQYKQEVKRIRKTISRLKSEGYNVDNVKIPKQVKNPTKKSIERLQKIRTKEIRKQTTYYDPVANKIVTGEEELKLRRSRASKKGWETRRSKGKSRSNTAESFTATENLPSIADNVLYNVEQLISNWQPLPQWSKSFVELKAYDKNRLDSMLNGAIAELGREVVAQNLESQADRVMDLAWEICYGGSGTTNDKQADVDLVEFNVIARGRPLTPEESIAVQNMENGESYGFEEE